MTPEQLKTLVQNSLEDLKAVDIQIIDLKGKADFADYMVIAWAALRSMARRLPSCAPTLFPSRIGVWVINARCVHWHRAFFFLD